MRLEVFEQLLLEPLSQLFQRVLVRGNLVIMVGYSICPNKLLDGPAIWTARIERGLVREWRIYEDTQENKKRFNLT